MSYILGALKKAEKERSLDKPVDLDSWNQDDWNQIDSGKGNTGLMLWLVSGTLLLVLLLFGWVAYTVTRSEIEPSSVQIDAHPVSNSRVLENDIEVEQRVALPVTVEQANDVQQQAESTNALSKDALPTFSGHIYFPNNSNLSRVFSGSGGYREGEFVEGYAIEKIYEDVVILRLDGREIEVKLDR